MGWGDWIWASSSTSSIEKPQTPSAPSTLRNEQTQSSSPTPRAPLKPLTRDEVAEAEFRDLLRELDQPPAFLSTLPGDSPLPRHADPLQVPSSLSSRTSHQIDPDVIHPTSLLPTEMSCRAAFDAAFYCQSMGGQFVNVYRYGGVRSCSELWNNFWFCMRTNRGGLGDEEREDQIRKHYWERQSKYRTGPSSEDVWEVRTRKIQAPFEGDFEAFEKSQDR